MFCVFFSSEGNIIANDIVHKNKQQLFSCPMWGGVDPVLVS